MTDLEERFLGKFELQSHIWLMHTDDTFFIRKHGEDSLKQFVETITSFHPITKLTARWSKEK